VGTADFAVFPGATAFVGAGGVAEGCAVAVVLLTGSTFVGSTFADSSFSMSLLGREAFPGSVPNLVCVSARSLFFAVDGPDFAFGESECAATAEFADFAPVALDSAPDAAAADDGFAERCTKSLGTARKAATTSAPTMSGTMYRGLGLASL